MTSRDLIVIGGGAAGFFAALAAQQTYPSAKVTLLEKNAALLAKVRVSGGGRCNVTHACFDPRQLAENYPRGGKELIGPFHQFQPKDTIAWFEARGVPLKTEDDGRMFPVSNSSETIITCLTSEAQKGGVEVLTSQKIEALDKKGSCFEIQMKDGERLTSARLILATGSSTEGHGWAKHFGHTLQLPVPSLFTFNIPNSSLRTLSGISFAQVDVRISGTPFSETGPLLITHFGLSGPAVLKLSAWAARYLHEKRYCVEVLLNWLPARALEELLKGLQALKKSAPHKTLAMENPFEFPKSFWKLFLERAGERYSKRLNDLTAKDLLLLAEQLHKDPYQVEGKTTHKEEFVTCGGVTLKEIDFKTMESKICPGLFFAGEILDIDAITGGFNFQSAWTTGFIAGSAPGLGVGAARGGISS